MKQQNVNFQQNPTSDISSRHTNIHSSSLQTIYRRPMSKYLENAAKNKKKMYQSYVNCCQNKIQSEAPQAIFTGKGIFKFLTFGARGNSCTKPSNLCQNLKTIWPICAIEKYIFSAVKLLPIKTNRAAEKEGCNTCKKLPAPEVKGHIQLRCNLLT